MKKEITRCVKRFDNDAVGADLCVRPECRGGCFRGCVKIDTSSFFMFKAQTFPSPSLVFFLKFSYL